MAKTYGVPFPERHLMSVLSELLGIEHFTTSRGSTVRRDFLEAVARRLGVSGPDTLATKDDVLAAAVEAATKLDMDPDLFSPGMTVTDKALQRIIDGVVENWTLGPGGDDNADGAPKFDMDQIGLSVFPVPDPGAPPEQPALPTGQDALDMPIEALEDLIDPAHELGPVDRRLVAVAYREGQDNFRKAVLQAYRQGLYEACCITGHGPPQVLQAAHIVGHAEGGLAVVSNGLCLRSDLHALLDRRLIAVHETTLEVLTHPVLAPTPYAELAGHKIHVPNAVADRPAAAALKHRRLTAGLGDGL
jgi:hypothetical protein